MHTNLQKLKFIQNKINEIINQKQLKTKPEIIAVTKTFPIENIIPLLDSGHVHYGENKIQEAEDKWEKIKKNYKNLRLHMVGKLQSNKAKKAVYLFDYIHSLDNEKLAQKISQYQKELNKNVKLFIQLNLGDEKQKSGIALSNLKSFYNYCVNDLSLDVIGLMCLPPIDSNSDKYFKLLKKNSDDLNLKELSMGMSSDFESAIMNGSTFLRLGTLIMGERNIT
ncbi:YggS family pyridoxal phosphate-dependent enzyme [Pelagibacteraceae bacterium]|nr:YggS family pyridoxal phosphate-dependent enzyme [Pelagibacteraceae bacterium]